MTMTVQELKDFNRYLPEVVLKAPIKEIFETGKDKEVANFNLETGEEIVETIKTPTDAYYQELYSGEN